MGNKGPINVVLDIPAINEVIVYANQFNQEVGESANTIRTLCNQMTANETLSGGDGEQIKEAFGNIAKGCNSIEKSTAAIVRILNDRLSKMLQMNKGKTTDSAMEAAQKAQKQMGVIKE